MAHFTTILMVLATRTISLSTGLTTCPGFPGFCSESFPGQSCNVVCDFGRNNVPLCQEDGTWTDIPRCIEHDPGVEEQIPGTCPSIPGYCAQGFLNTQCKFNCVTGADIDSICTQDGTWAPYPTCAGDLRETRDGCDGCPGPGGERRNRTAEAIISRNTVSDRRVPKIIGSNSGRKNIPSFAGNINIGRLSPAQRTSTQNRVSQRKPAARVTPVTSTRNNQNLQTNFNQRKSQRQPTQQFNQGLNTFSPSSDSSQPLSLLDKIKNGINKGTGQEDQKARQPPIRPKADELPSLSPTQQRIRDQILRQRQQQAQDIGNILIEDSVQATSPQPSFQEQPQPSFQVQQSSGSTFGVFEEVNLAGRFGGPNPPQAQQAPRQQPEEDGFFGVFPEVNLQG